MLMEKYKTMKKTLGILQSVRCFSAKAIKPRVCVVGSGPAGFYATQQLLKLSSDVEVDILERLPVPFGLVRFGVAPDHPEVKNVINTFHKTAKNPRVRFFGNVNVGKDVTVGELRDNYHAVLLAYGAEEDRNLGIPGESLNNVIAGRDFVGWYNGLPWCKDLSINLDVEEAVIIGQGNVAVDIARILLKSVDELKTTDITSHALEHLARSRIKRVKLIGRRGPLQAALTIAELREMTKLTGCQTLWRAEDFKNVRELVPSLQRPRKRLIELMLKSLDACEGQTSAKEFSPIFFRSPREIVGSKSVQGVKFSVNELIGDDFTSQTAKDTGQVEEIACELVLRSIGYKSVRINGDIPFNERLGRLENCRGKVQEGVYSAGWVATGPVGVILSTMTNAFTVGTLIHEELVVAEEKPGNNGLLEALRRKNIQVVSYEDWETIDKVEQVRGEARGKVREKIIDIQEMLDLVAR